MKTGDRVYTPRFCTVIIEQVFDNEEEARGAGYTEPTHFHKDGWTVFGKSLDVYHMEFAGCREGRR